VPLTSPRRLIRATPAARVTVAKPAAWARAWTWAGASIALGLVAHLAGGGGFAIDALLASVIVLVVVSRVAALTEVRLLPMLALLAAGQWFVHTMFVATCRTSVTPTTNDAQRMTLLHALAVVIVALLLRRREAAAWTHARWRSFMKVVARALSARPATSVVTQRISAFVVTVDVWSMVARCASALPSRRGPPRFQLA